MNYSVVRFIMGRVYGVFALLLLAPLTVSIYFGESVVVRSSWLIPILISLLLYYIMGRKPPKEKTFYAREGMVICAMMWLTLAFLGGLPLYFSGEYPSIIDGFFEISSGLTTTGASVATNVEALSHSILFWRSFTHLIGGMGVLVFVLAFLPHTSSSSVQIAKAEMPGPTFGKIVARLSDTTRILYTLYLGMTAVLTLLLLFGGMPLFDAVCHAFGTAGTGGFGIKQSSVAYYQSPYIEWVLAIGMLVFAVNMNLYYFVLIRQAKELWKDEEFHWFLGFVGLFVGLICLNLLPRYLAVHESMEKLLRDVTFSVSSLISTTGYATVDFSQWPVFSRFVLLLAMIVGGCGGSTAGGFKVSRVAMSIKSGFRTLRQTRNPRQILPLHFNGEPVKDSMARALHGYLSFYLLLILVLILVVSMDPIADSLETSVSTVLATFNNVGPGLSLVVGPAGSYAGFQPFTKVILSIGMIAGRLEMWPILILFSPRTLKKH